VLDAFLMASRSRSGPYHGVVNVVPAAVKWALPGEHPGVDKVSFTRIHRRGPLDRRSVRRVHGRSPSKLGGKSAAIVLDDDLAASIEQFFGVTLSNTEILLAQRRVLVPRTDTPKSSITITICALADRGDPLDPETRSAVGSERQRDRVEATRQGQE